ncbi:carbohydrate esterase family 9 protein [Macrolepiota fuliginosa MF-IS2]|uniref:Carbohydrate esterase family 9 protein n=1 Tax=Macrolepiota fuliginosa MF-IS2 TaxID=1400762 RepID=A0A9P5XJN0_9AGAR|nr:carbohydrate esterase family 9 protein [Macrolepiota fuliginosa MF-IS2]
MKAHGNTHRSLSLTSMFSRSFLWGLAFLACAYFLFYRRLWQDSTDLSQGPPYIQAAVAKCLSLQQEPGPPPDFWKRSRSDRYEPGTRPVLLKGGRIWTGRKNGTEVIFGDVLMEKGIIKSVGNLGWLDLTTFGSDLQVIDAKGAWITPGLVDVHSHIGDFSLPVLEGSNDGNSLHGIVQPWLRSLDGLNTHDETYPLSLAGGVTASLVLPGSADAIGGQAFVIKLRETSEKSPSSMLVEPPYQINDTFPDPNLPFRWRHMKHACGENPSRTYQGTRMDTSWAFREAYAKARKIKQEQDKFCSSVLNSNWQLNDPHFPEELQWEALVDVLRGRVKVNTHCYEAVDLDDFVRLTNEFEFPVAAFHHASEAYLVPDVIKRAYGNTPYIALFATFARYKREAYRSSEFAPKVLAQNGITVLMKSDHPAALDSRHLIYEAQQAFFYGLPHNLAIASVTSNAAEALGLGHRLGYVREGWDADIVVWDSHPLALGATPTQVFVDGLPQLRAAIKVEKPANFQRLPKVPRFDKEAAEAVKYEGLPPLEPAKKLLGTVVFTNVKSVYRPGAYGVQGQTITEGNAELGVVVVQNGTIACSSLQDTCLTGSLLTDPDVTMVDLGGGSISPGFVSYGSPLGLEDITSEPSTNDGFVPDGLVQSVPQILGGDFLLVHAADGLQFGTRNALLAYRSGITSAITAPSHKAFVGGLGVSFSLGALNKLEKNAMIQEITGLHVSIGHFSRPSVSSQVAALRRLLLGPAIGAMGSYFEKVKHGSIPLIVEAHNSDIIATLLILKSEFEMRMRRSLRLTITGASEAHFLAKELADAGVGIILTPARPLPSTWEKRRILPGPPITRETTLSVLLKHGVTVGIGSERAYAARELPFDIAWAAIESGGQISKEEAFGIGSVNIERLLGVERDSAGMDLVATRGGDLLDFGAEVVAIISPEQELVGLLRDD